MKLRPLSLVKKLRLIDYLIILIVLSLIYILFKFFNPEQQWITMVVLDDNVPIHQAAALQKGDSEKGPTGKVTAKIIDINRIDSEEKFDRTLISLTPLPEDVFVTVRVLAKVNSRTKELQYKNRTILVGSIIDFQFNSGFIRGGVVEIEGFNQLPGKITKEIIVELYDQPKWLADGIEVGSGESEESGQKIIEVLSREVTPSANNLLGESGTNSKVNIRLGLRAYVNNFQKQFLLRNNMQILIGNKLTFKANNTLVKDAMVVEIK